MRSIALALLVLLSACESNNSVDAGLATEGGSTGDASLDANATLDAGSTGDASTTLDASVFDAAAVLDGSSGTDGAAPGPDEILRVTFEPATIGPYAREDLDAEWGDVRWASVERAEVMAAEGTSAGRFLRVHYPTGAVGPGEGGAQFWVNLPESYERLFISYRVRFGAGFDFVRGGKLPGLLGGDGNTGGSMPDGTDGWSGRMMWRSSGDAVQYVYHPDQPGTYGDNLRWEVGGQRRFDDEWHVVEHEIVMNSPRANDGAVRGWWDGAPALDREGMRFRDVDTFAIDGFYFSTFFGGGDPTWAPTRNEHVDFDTFIFSTSPITH